MRQLPACPTYVSHMPTPNAPSLEDRHAINSEQYDGPYYVGARSNVILSRAAWGTDLNNEDKVQGFAEMLASYAPRLRGLTYYPDGARGGQLLTSVPYDEAKRQVELELKQHDTCKGRGV